MSELALVQGNNGILEATTKIQDYVTCSKAANTLKAYQSDWADFTSWCNTRGLAALPASQETVAVYLTDLVERGYKASTIERRLISIAKAHVTAGFNDVTKTALVKEVWAGIKRKVGTAQQGKAAAVTADIRLMVAALDDSLLGIRDRALLLIGFAGAFRRSELVGLDVEDLDFRREGLVISIRKSKTDQEGKGRQVAICYGSHPETCPVRALQAWLEAADINEGPVFRSVNRHGRVQADRLSDKSVALVVKRCAEAAGLDASKYSGHSLRAGLATSAAMAGVSERAIMNQTGHRSQAMVRRYIRQGSLFQENASASLGL